MALILITSYVICIRLRMIFLWGEGERLLYFWHIEYMLRCRGKAVEGCFNKKIAQNEALKTFSHIHSEKNIRRQRRPAYCEGRCGESPRLRMKNQKTLPFNISLVFPRIYCNTRTPRPLLMSLERLKSARLSNVGEEDPKVGFS